MSKILKAEPLISSTLEQLKQDVNLLKKRNINPLMRIILVGENPASLSYVRNKMRLCKKIGASAELVQLPKDVSLNDFQKVINDTNANSKIHGAIIQLPLPGHLRQVDINKAIAPHKDIDGFHILNIEALYLAKNTDKFLLPCTPLGIVSMLSFYQIPISGTNILIIGRSLLVGRPLSLMLTNHHATVTVAHSQTKNLISLSKTADIVISAVGKAQYFDEKYLNDEKRQVLIDVGINQTEKGLVGDMKFDSLVNNCQAITPVPGGIGPLTVLSLIKNLIKACQLQNL